MRRIKALYDYQHIEREKKYSHKESVEQRTWIIFIVIAIVSGVIVLIRYNRDRRAIIREQEKKLYETSEQRYRESQPCIREDKKKIKELKEKVKSFEQGNNDLQQKLLFAKEEKLGQTNQAIETLQREQALLEEALRRSDICIYCYRAIEDSSIRLTKAEWKELENIINGTYNDLTSELFILHLSIAKMELCICLLLEIKILVSIVSQLVYRTQGAVSMSRKQPYKKIFNKERAPTNLDDFAVSFQKDKPGL